MKEKIHNALKIRTHALRALQLVCCRAGPEGGGVTAPPWRMSSSHVGFASQDPADPTVRYILGSWCYNVAAMSWIECKVASSVFGAPLEATNEEALEYFMTAETKAPGAPPPRPPIRLCIPPSPPPRAAGRAGMWRAGGLSGVDRAAWCAAQGTGSRIGSAWARFGRGCRYSFPYAVICIFGCAAAASICAFACAICISECAQVLLRLGRAADARRYLRLATEMEEKLDEDPADRELAIKILRSIPDASQ